MEYAVIFFGLLSIGCTCMIFAVISTYNKKISEIHKVIANLHIKTMKTEDALKSLGNQPQKENGNFKKEIIYKIPKKLFGELRMRNNGKEAVVKASLSVEKVEQ